VTNKAIATYRTIYDLPEINYEEEVPDGVFKHYLKRHNFVIIGIYNARNNFLLIRDFNKNVGWELPGGFIEESETIEDAVNRITLDETDLEIDELEPIAVVNNTFRSDRKSVTHTGIAFMALSRGKVRQYPKNIQMHYAGHITERVAFQNEKILTLAKERLMGKSFKPPFEEIESVKQKNFIPFYLFHRYIVKPFGSLSSKKLSKEIFSLIEGKPKSILDASCGDSSIINQLCEHYSPEICIGNDISWRTISLMKDKHPGVVFTNHNALELPYKYKFDLVIFKNTLHHINRKDQLSVLKNLKKLAKQLIIIDINDPRNTGFIPRLWNNYYVYILGDQGESFLNFKDFQSLALPHYKEMKMYVGTVNTVKGQYYFGSFTEDSHQTA
jgi:ADP-ribose pyrophosphatase YjhB (NUDIX family)/SAM-dependent methyltransferase